MGIEESTYEIYFHCGSQPLAKKKKHSWFDYCQYIFQLDRQDTKEVDSHLCQDKVKQTFRIPTIQKRHSDYLVTQISLSLFHPLVECSRSEALVLCACQRLLK